MRAIGTKGIRRCALLLAFALLAACGGDPAPPEERIGALIDAMEQAIEAGSCLLYTSDASDDPNLV